MTPTTVTEGILASLAPWNDSDGHWITYCTNLAAMFEQVFSIVSDQGSPDDPDNYTAGWSGLLDPTAAPAQFLPYTGMFPGVYVAPGTDEATARALILAEGGFSRGTPRSVIMAAQLWLNGTQTVNLFERLAADGATVDPYHFVLAVLSSEVVDAVQLAAAVDAVRPVGVQWTLVQTSAWTIADLEAGFATVTLVEAGFTSVSHLETDT